MFHEFSSTLPLGVVYWIQARDMLCGTYKVMLSKHFKFLTFKYLIKCFIPDSCPEFNGRLSSLL